MPSEEELENIYEKKHVQNKVDDDELSPEEAGFMEGYNQAEDYVEDIEEDKSTEEEILK